MEPSGVMAPMLTLAQEVRKSRDMENISVSSKAEHDGLYLILQRDTENNNTWNDIK